MANLRENRETASLTKVNKWYLWLNWEKNISLNPWGHCGIWNKVTVNTKWLLQRLRSVRSVYGRQLMLELHLKYNLILMLQDAVNETWHNFFCRLLIKECLFLQNIKLFYYCNFLTAIKVENKVLFAVVNLTILYILRVNKKNWKFIRYGLSFIESRQCIHKRAGTCSLS